MINAQVIIENCENVARYVFREDLEGGQKHLIELLKTKICELTITINRGQQQ